MSTPKRNESGQAMILSIIVIVALTGLVSSTLSIVESSRRETSSGQMLIRALYIAEAGAQSSVLSVSGGGDGIMGSESSPIPFDGGTFWVQSVANEDGTYRLASTGTLNGVTRRVEAVVEEIDNVFHNALFAGNSSGDENYVMNLEGWGGQADSIHGDVYCGGDIAISEDAFITGSASASGIVTGMAGKEGATQPIPDIAGMGYETTHDVNVANEFAGNERWESRSAGGSAYEVPEINSAHIFRKNPNDRTSENNSTQKDDYYLEDGYEPVRNDYDQDGSDPYMITLGSSVLSEGNTKVVYYIDGNLWIHNRPTLSFSIASPTADGIQITFVVKGNITFSDNIFYDNPEKDGVAFIAINDENVPDSGNIYFGDPSGGTLEQMNGFLYAENNFYDINLNAGGSKNILVNGTMSAGNHVSIQRTYGTSHSQLTVNADDRIISGELSMPGVPTSAQSLQYRVALWHRISLHSE